MTVLHQSSFLRIPSIHALIIQCLSFLLLLGTLYGLARLANVHLSVTAAVLLQGAFAAVLSLWRGLAPWWLPIQFFFPGALIATLSLDLPPVLFLAAFALLLALYWTTFRTQVPFFPSGFATWEAVAGLLPQDRAICFVDIGSGLGGLVLHLAARRKDCTFTGIELAPLPWLISAMRASGLRSRAHFKRGDYGALDLARYDVVFAYLSPAVMPALWEKAQSEMRPGTLLLSYEFPIPDVKSHIIMLPAAHGPALYGWRM